jgi:hypothetical protein
MLARTVGSFSLACTDLLSLYVSSWKILKRTTTLLPVPTACSLRLREPIGKVWEIHSTNKLPKEGPINADTWEKAKEGALTEIESEESGKSLPRRLFKRFFSRGGSSVEAEVIEALPAESGNRKSSSAPKA